MSADSHRGNAQRGQAPAARRGGHETRSALIRVLEPVVAGTGFDLEDIVVTPAGKRRQVRVVVDADGGVNLDGVAVVSQAVSSALDESEAMGSAPYVLEVTSPGVDRPLTEPRHWRRAVHRLVRVTPAQGGEFVGRIDHADDTVVVFDVEGKERRLGHDELVRGIVQVEFNRRAESDENDEDTDGDEN